ncbi:hypothetical protein PSAC2689_190093 [Paraburkholderia sacchari]
MPDIPTCCRGRAQRIALYAGSDELACGAVSGATLWDRRAASGQYGSIPLSIPLWRPENLQVFWKPYIISRL